MSRFIRRMFLLTSVSALFVGNVSADIILDYNVADSELGDLSPTNVNKNISGDNMAAGSGLTVKPSGPTWNWRNWDTDNNSFADAVADNDVWTWGFDVNTVIELELTTMDIRLRRSNLGPRDFEIQASVNGGTAVSLFTHDFGSSTDKTDFLGIDLSAIGTLTQGDSVVFTLGAWDSDNINAAFDLEPFETQSHGLRINGDITSIPEPATIGWLAGMGILAWMGRRKSSSQKQHILKQTGQL